MQEFQAIVLAAGRGTRLSEVVGTSPKCLLPIGPFPLLWYSLNTLQKHNFQDAIVVVLENEKLEIQQALESCPLKMKLEFLTIPVDKDFGTADTLRHIHDKIKYDFIVFSCDTVTNASLFPIINKFREHNASMVALLFKTGFESDFIVPGPKTKYKSEKDLIGIRPNLNRLLFLASTSDFEEVMSVIGHLLRKNGKMTVHSRLLDSHIYIMKRWVLDFLNQKQNFSTFKGEFLPYLIKKQMTNSVPFKDSPQSEYGINLKPENDILNFVPYSNLDQKILRTSLFNDTRLKDPYDGDTIRCYAIEAPKDTIGIRVNTTLNFFAINQRLPFIWSELLNENKFPIISESAVVNSTQIKDISAGENATLSEKTSLSSSLFGPNCSIGSKNIINKSIVMANAIVEEKCTIENCIIGYKAVVKKGSVLKNCLIGPNFVVEEESKKEFLHLTNADGFMEIEYTE